jgi:hypothetical protein
MTFTPDEMTWTGTWASQDGTEIVRGWFLPVDVTYTGSWLKLGGDASTAVRGTFTPTDQSVNGGWIKADGTGTPGRWTADGTPIPGTITTEDVSLGHPDSIGTWTTLRTSVTGTWFSLP